MTIFTLLFFIFLSLVVYLIIHVLWTKIEKHFDKHDFRTQMIQVESARTVEMPNFKLQELAQSVGASKIELNDRSSILFSPLELEQYTKKAVGDSIIDFYRRYLDLDSDDDITVQVEKYVKVTFKDNHEN